MNVKVYGLDHSPWVQAVLLALHDKGLDHCVHSLPLVIFLMSKVLR